MKNKGGEMNKKSQTKLVIVGIFIFIFIGLVFALSNQNKTETFPDIYTNQSVVQVKLPEGLDDGSGYSLIVFGGADGRVVDGILEIYSIESNVTVSLKLKNTNFTADFSVFFVKKGEQQKKVIKEVVGIDESGIDESIKNTAEEVIVEESSNEESSNKSFSNGNVIEENQTIEKENLTKGITGQVVIEKNITETNETFANETEINISEEANATITNIIANATIQTIQYKAVIGKPVKWKKVVEKLAEDSVIIELPEKTINLTVKKINKQKEQEIIKQVQFKDVGGVGVGFGFVFKTSVYNWFKNLFSFILPSVLAQEEIVEVTETSSKIEVEISDNSTNYEVEYYTEAPVAVEEVISSNRKKITISGPDELHYENILAFTELPEQLTPEDKYKIKLYNVNNNLREIVEIVNYEDSNEDGLIDTVYWIVPHLSTQEYELIIEITKAEHLDLNRNFISDIYDEVKSQDGVWSEVINSGEYVRVTFEQALDRTKDITIYARIASLIINGQEVPYDIYQKKKRIDEIRRLLG